MALSLPKRGGGEGAVGVVRLQQDFFEVRATPTDGGAFIGEEFAAPAAGEAAGGWPVEVAADGGADVVADDAVEGDGVGATDGAGAEQRSTSSPPLT